MPFDEENEDTLPELYKADTLPNIPEWTPPPGPARRPRRLREYLGTAGVVLAVVVILTGIALASSFIPAVRHGVSKVMRHQETVKSPSLRDGSTTPTGFPPSRGAVVNITPRTSRSAGHTVSPSRTAPPTPAKTRPAARPSPTRNSVSPTQAPTTVSPPPTPPPTPTPTQAPPTPTPTPTLSTVSPTATAVVSATAPSVEPVPSIS